VPKIDSVRPGAPCWIELFTSDPDAATAFYGELLGWTAEVGGPEYGGYITFSKDGLRVAGGMLNDGSSGTPDTWSVYLATEDAAATVASAKGAGATVVVESMPIGEGGRMGTMAVLVDPAGALVGAWQPGEHTGFQLAAEVGSPGWFELHTRDYRGALAFYEGVFGWDTHVQSDTDEFRYSTAGEGEDATAGVMDAASFLPEGVPSAWSVYFVVADTDAAVAKAVELGGSVVQPAEDSPYGRLATVADSTGTAFRLVADMNLTG
jgi:predicted enzyme related to lactoylglutathione lyase